MSRLGTVLETADDRATVSTARRGICASCSEHSTCGISQASAGGVAEEVEVLNPVGARSGDFVQFDLPGHTELKVALLIWAVPLAGLIIGAVLGARFHEALSMERDPATLLGAVIGLALTFACVRLVDRRAASDERLTPRITRVVHPVGLDCPEIREDTRNDTPDSESSAELETDS